MGNEPKPRKKLDAQNISKSFHPFSVMLIKPGIVGVGGRDVGTGEAVLTLDG